MTMFRSLALLLVVAGAASSLAHNQQPKVTIDNLAYFQVTGSSVSGTADKRLELYILHYNAAAIPCVLVDSQKRDSILTSAPVSAAISCGWTAANIAALQE